MAREEGDGGQEGGWWGMKGRKLEGACRPGESVADELRSGFYL